VDQVLEAENEPERYAQLQAANPFRTGVADRALRRYQLNLEEFAGVVVEDAPSTSRWRIGGTLARVSENTRVATGKVVNLIEGN
jgi:hypothetical protein